MFYYLPIPGTQCPMVGHNVPRGGTQTDTPRDTVSRPSEPPINPQRTNGASAPSGVWDVARGWVGRPLLTKLLKTHEEEAVKQAVFRTLDKRPADPKTYFLGALKENGDASPVWQKTDAELMALAQERGISTGGKTRQQLINELR